MCNKEGQPWKIWKDLSQERDVPLVTSHEGCEPYSPKITKVERDPRNKSLEKPIEFNSMIKSNAKTTKVVQ